MQIDYAAVEAAKRKPISQLTAEERILIWNSEQAAAAAAKARNGSGDKRQEQRGTAGGEDSQADTESGAYACVRMSAVPPEKVAWLWKPYLPVGKITLLDGWPGIGKSWLTCKLAAIVTRGGGFPNGQAFDPGNVLMFSAEDGLADTLRPRLDACGADVDRIIALNFLEKDGLAIFDQKGLLRFEATIIEYHPLLVIVDPLFAFTGGAIDINRANECREVSRVLAAIAARQRSNMLCVRHLGKSFVRQRSVLGSNPTNRGAKTAARVRNGFGGFRPKALKASKPPPKMSIKVSINILG